MEHQEFIETLVTQRRIGKALLCVCFSVLPEFRGSRYTDHVGLHRGPCVRTTYTFTVVTAKDPEAGVRT